MLGEKTLLTGDKEVIADWVLDQIDGGEAVKSTLNSIWWDALATLDENGEIIGGVIYLNLKTGEKACDIELQAAGLPGWLDRRFLKAYFGYPFNRLGATRVTTIVAKRNKKARKLQMRLGFVEEGNARQAMSDGGDAMIYGMLKDECRWIDHETCENKNGTMK